MPKDKNGWIRCSDRLPTSLVGMTASAPVLIISKDYLRVVIGRYDHFGKCWIFENLHEIKNVTHWHPLPELPND